MKREEEERLEMEAADTLEAEREWEEAEAARLEREAEEAARQAEMEALVGAKRRSSVYSWETVDELDIRVKGAGLHGQQNSVLVQCFFPCSRHTPKLSSMRHHFVFSLQLEAERNAAQGEAEEAEEEEEEDKDD